jgi:hypothetical protein
MNDPESSVTHSALWLALQSLTHGAGVQRDDLLEALTGELGELRRYWGTNLVQTDDAGHLSAVEVARRVVRTNLDLHIRKLHPPKRVDSRKYTYSILVCFNMQTDLAHVPLKDRDLSARRNWLADRAPAQLRVSVSTSQRYLDQAINQIEQQILAAGYEPAHTPRGDLQPTATTLGEAADAIIGAPAPEARTPFIPRPYLAEQLDEAWSMTQRVCVIGEAGTGKSRFVREHTAADNPVWIDAREDVTMLPGLTNTLTRYGVEVAHYDTPRIKHAFGELLTRDDGPDLVVMDGVPEPAQLDLFIPEPIRSRLLVTSSQRPGNKATVIAVTDMQLEEATAMAAALLPGFSDDDYRSLAATFGCRPILIEHSCRYLLQETGTPDIPAYCDAVREDIAAAIGAAARKAGRTEPILTVIYQKYVQRLEQESPRSIELLELLCFVSHLNVPPAYAMAYLLGVPMITPELLERAQLRYEDAVQPLVDYSLVSVMPGYGTSMQPLTQRILRGIFQDRFPTVIQRAQPLLQHHDRAGLFEAGWSIFTVAGYLTCNHILTVQAKEYVWPFLSADLRARFAPADAPPPLDGVTESAQWPLIVTELWKRMCGFATFLWDERHAVPERPDTSGDITTADLSRDAVLARFKPGRFGIQNEETEAVRNIIFTLMLHVYVGDVYQAWNRDTNQAMFEFNLRDIMTRMLQRYQDSPLGQLDLGLFFPNADDTVEQVLKTADASGTIAVTRLDTPSEHLPAQSKEGPDLRATELATPTAIDARERDVKNSGDLRLLGVG